MKDHKYEAYLAELREQADARLEEMREDLDKRFQGLPDVLVSIFHEAFNSKVEFMNTDEIERFWEDYSF